MEGCVSVIEPGNKYQSLPINNVFILIVKLIIKYSLISFLLVSGIK